MSSVIYFPSFLFEFPDRIYLEGNAADSKKHEFYRTILQDVLDTIGENTNLKEHVLDRAKEGSFFARQSLESVLLKMGSHISSTVFKKWDRIFKRPSGHKEIVVSYGQDEEKLWFLQLRLKDRDELYTISERSLGFRWFLAFLLLTQYRGFREVSPKNVLFLFDEPASNLHPSAQAQLLESFKTFPDNCSIIYTTHSHHMINPAWLENTFVVKNKALDYSQNDDDYTAQRAEITLEKYREFAVNHPNQTTYFQPILDVLDFAPGKLENVPNVVMVEGKNDFYLLKYFQEKIVNFPNGINLIPGNGSGSLDVVIRLYIAWGREFIVLLDSDQAGTSHKKRYEDVFGVLVKDRIFWIGDIDSTWNGQEIEYLIEDNDRLLIQTQSYPNEKKYYKTHFNRAIQAAYLLDQHFPLSQKTKNNVEQVLSFCATHLTR